MSAPATDLALKAAQYFGFKDLAFGVGFGKQTPRKVDITTRVTYDSDGAQESATNEFTLYLFNESSPTSTYFSRKTQNPKIEDNRAMGPDHLACVHGLTVVVNQQTSTFTAVEVNEILEKLPEHVLVIQNGTEIIYERQIGFIMSGYPGYILGNDGKASAGDSNPSRSAVDPMRVGDHFEDPLIVGPGSTLRAAIVGGPTSWTTTDDILVDLKLHSWLGLRGHSENVKTSTILGLSDARARAAELKAMYG